MKKIAILIAILIVVAGAMFGGSGGSRKSYTIDGINFNLIGDIREAKKAIPTARILICKNRVEKGPSSHDVSFYQKTTFIHVSVKDGQKHSIIYAPRKLL